MQGLQFWIVRKDYAFAFIEKLLDMSKRYKLDT